jgi:hypothetical protein
LADRFPDGQIFLELYGHSPTQAPRDPADALACLLAATGTDPSILPHTVDDRARLWRDRIAGKKVLLVLDDAAGHDQLRPPAPRHTRLFRGDHQPPPVARPLTASTHSPSMCCHPSRPPACCSR